MIPYNAGTSSDSDKKWKNQGILIGVLTRVSLRFFFTILKEIEKYALLR